MAIIIHEEAVNGMMYYWMENGVISTDPDGLQRVSDPYYPKTIKFSTPVIVNGNACWLYSNGAIEKVEEPGKNPLNYSRITTTSESDIEESIKNLKPTDKNYESTYGNNVNDGKYSEKIVGDSKYNFDENDKPDGKKINNFINNMDVISVDGYGIDITQSQIYKSILASKNLLPPDNDQLFNETFRFGYFNIGAPLTRVKEYLFFTKPDLNILIKSDDTTVKEIYSMLDAKPTSGWTLNPGLLSPFWIDMRDSKKRIIKCLQSSFSEPNDRDDPFIHLLSNQVNTNLEIPELSSEVVETATNRYGTSIFYRGSSEPSDDGLSFSLEFKDTKWLDVYYFFRAYEEYQIAKHLGTLVVKPEYIRDKILYDQIAIYKIVVDMDMETILYWGKYYGVAPLTLPRDTFSTDTFDNGISYSIQFKAQFYEDMKPEILADFNDLNKKFFNDNQLYYKNPSAKTYHRTRSDGKLHDYGVYNSILGRADNRPAIGAYVEKALSTNSKRASISPNKYIYKLHWRGVERY